MTVGQFIVGSLQNDGLEFRHPVYKRFVEIMAEHLEDKDFNSQKFFMSHPETFVSLTAASLMEERYQLSTIFKDSKPADDETQLLKLTRHIMADYQMEVVRLEIKDCIQNTLQPLGVMVVIEASHMCMQMRGVEKQNSVTTTSDFTGAFNQAKTREEFMNLISRK